MTDLLLFALNDTPRNADSEIIASVYFNEKLIETYKVVGTAESVSATYMGDVKVSASGFSGKIKVVAKMVSGGVVTYDEVCLESAPRNKKAWHTPIILSEKLKSVEKLCDSLD